MTQAEQIIQKALSFVGTTENPPYSNNVIFNTDYYERPVSGNYPWCCTFVWDIFRMCGLSALFYGGNKTASCIRVYDWGKAEKLIVSEGRRGDLVLFDWNANKVPDHIGFILSRNANGTYETVEGNTSVTSNDNGGAVMRRTRSAKEILAFIRPKYEEEPVVKRFHSVGELPSYYQPEIQELIDAGAIANGDIDMTEDMVRDVIISKRYAETLVSQTVKKIAELLAQKFGV